jgi:predicted AlkP superfamily phosphohydrolase/phosphomutase
MKKLFPRLRERIASEFLFSGVDWSRTLAYHTAEFPGSLRINMKGREVNGIVKPGEDFEAVYEAIRSGLERYEDPETGRKIVKRVFRREEIYWGPYLDKAPDLIVALDDDSYTFDWYIPMAHKSTQRALPIVDALRGKYAANCGSHRPEGILMLQGKNIRSGVQIGSARIYDVMPTVLYLMGLPVPATMDGHVLTEAIEDHVLKKKPVVIEEVTESPSKTPSNDDPYSDEDEEAVAHRLRDLGYL